MYKLNLASLKVSCLQYDPIFTLTSCHFLSGCSKPIRGLHWEYALIRRWIAKELGKLSPPLWVLLANQMAALEICLYKEMDSQGTEQAVTFPVGALANQRAALEICPYKVMVLKGKTHLTASTWSGPGKWELLLGLYKVTLGPRNSVPWELSLHLDHLEPPDQTLPPINPILFNLTSS